MVLIERLDEPGRPTRGSRSSARRRSRGAASSSAGLLKSSLGLEPDPWPEKIDRTARIEALRPDEVESLAAACRPR
jgi:hypothetical protein